MPASGTALCAGGDGTSNGWFTSRPGSYTLKGGDGPTTIYLWVADSVRGVKSGGSVNITLDTTPPGGFTVTGVGGGPIDAVYDTYLLNNGSVPSSVTVEFAASATAT